MSKKTPLYPRLLRLRHVHPNAWQRAALGEGAFAAAAVLVLADVASAWTLLVLPLAVAAVVKAHDVLAGLLASRPAAARETAETGTADIAAVTTPDNDDGAGPAGTGAVGRREGGQPAGLPASSA